MEASTMYMIVEFKNLRDRGKDWTESWATCPT